MPLRNGPRQRAANEASYAGPMPAFHPASRAALAAFVLCLACIAGCTTSAAPGSAQVLLYGEQHDQPDHQRRVAAEIERLARAGRLGAVVIEMAERGRSTTGLPRGADAAQVRAALAWGGPGGSGGWDWDTYAPVVLAAVRAGVPVFGGNLPRDQLRAAMADAARDAQVDAAARERLAVAVREGHCGLLPAAQEPGMVRVQIARDRSMAEAIAAAPKVVLLLTGAQHAARDRGVPRHLATIAPELGVQVTIFGAPIGGLVADRWQAAERVSRPDPCEGLARQLGRPMDRPGPAAPAQPPASP